MKETVFLMIICLNIMPLIAQDDLFKYLISLYPDSELYQYILGLTYRQKGDIEQARASFNEALKINPEFNEAKTALDKLKLK